MDSHQGEEALHSINDPDFLINFLNNDPKNGLVQNPLVNSYSNQNLFQIGELGYPATASGIGGGQTNYSQYNLEDISKYVAQQNSNQSQMIGDTTDYYSQHMRKNPSSYSSLQATAAARSLPNSQQLNHLGNFHHQNHNQQAYLYQGSTHNQGMKQEQNGMASFHTTKLEDQNLQEFANQYSSQGGLKRNDNLLESNKNLFNYKNNYKNTIKNKISSLITDTVSIKNQEQQQQEQIQNPPSQWIQKDPKQQADEIFKGPIKNPSVFPYQLQGMGGIGGLGQLNQLNGINNLNSNFKVPLNSQQQQEQLQLNSQQIQQQLKKARSFETIKADEYEKINQKLVRNRESARNSRKRKKIYIELLETKVQNLTEELEKTKRALDTNNQYLNKLSLQTQILNGFIFGRQQLYEKIEKQIQQNVEQNEICLLLDSLQFRLGATGKERITAINYFFKQILDIYVPTHYRYLLWSSQESNSASYHTFNYEKCLDFDIFNEDGSDLEKRAPWRQELLNTLQVSEQQIKQMQKLKKRFVSEKLKYDEIIENFQSVKKQMQERAQNVEKVVDDMRTVFNPFQFAKFLLFLEKNKYRREISNSNIWEIFKKENGEYDFDEEGLMDQHSLLNTHILSQTNLAGGNCSTDMVGGFNFSNNNLVEFNHGLNTHVIHDMSDEGQGNHHHHDEEEDEDDDEEDSHLQKINQKEGPRKKIQTKQVNGGYC